MISKISIPTIPLIILMVLLAINVILIGKFAESYFNSTEIRTLVENAHAKNIDYKLVIHNSFTNSYSFTTFDK